MIVQQIILTWLLVIIVATNQAYAAVDDCDAGTRLMHSFASGASWTLCARTDKQHALEVSQVHYRAPGDTSRSVLDIAHIGQILIHYHDETQARAQINTRQLPRLVSMTANNCDGELLLYDGADASLCSRIEDNRPLAKYAQRPSLQSQRWELSSALQREGLIWAISITFTEDGQITPALSLSGRARQSDGPESSVATLPGSGQRLSRATLLATWRLAFNLDNGNTDAVQQFDFALDVTRGNRRPMQVTELGIETLATVDRSRFRGWRVTDPAGAGYYLDPSNSGFSFTGSQYNWARFDVALTGFKACERYAVNNVALADTSATCGASLDDFVNGESLIDTHPVLWFSQTRTLNPGNEHWPVISHVHQSFTLLPFDWTSSSPFEVIE